MQDTDPIPASRATLLTDWLRLEGARGVGLRTAHLLLAAFGSPRAIFEAGHAALAAQVGPALARTLCAPPSRHTLALIDTTLAWLAAPAHHVLALGDAAYPQALANIPDPPLLLYIRGRIDLLARPALAIVGSRNATVQGKANAAAFAGALSRRGRVRGLGPGPWHRCRRARRRIARRRLDHRRGRHRRRFVLSGAQPGARRTHRPRRLHRQRIRARHAAQQRQFPAPQPDHQRLVVRRAGGRSGRAIGFPDHGARGRRTGQGSVRLARLDPRAAGQGLPPADTRWRAAGGDRE